MTKLSLSPKSKSLVNLTTANIPVKKANGGWILLAPKSKIRDVNPDNYPNLPKGVVLK